MGPLPLVRRREDADGMRIPLMALRRRDDFVVGLKVRSLSLWIERAAWVAGVALLATYGGMRLWAEEARAEAIQEFRAATLAPADQSLWSHQRVVAYREAQRTGDAPQAVLRIPKLTLEVPVYGDTSEFNLDRGAGRIPGTATLEDKAGNVGIAAHRDGFFRKLKDVELGMDLFIEHGGRTLRYHVTEISIVTPEESGVLAPTATPSVTLVTCYPFYFVGSAPKRFIVRAELDATQTHNDDLFNRNMQRRET
jgi:sortase A